MPADKRWVLLSNYGDNTMLRNHTAFELGHLSALDWTPSSAFAEVFVNGTYQGTYQITQKVEESRNRVNITNEGFLLEIDYASKKEQDGVYIRTQKLQVKIKDPSDIKYGSSEYSYLKEYFIAAENALFGDQFDDPEVGYSKYLDVASFVDWYLINETVKNNDAVNLNSGYFNIIPGGKLKMGPIWDFDITFGNLAYNGKNNHEGFSVKHAIWITRLFEDPNFVQKVKDRFLYFKGKKELILQGLREKANELEWAQEENDRVWKTIGNTERFDYNAEALGSYESEIEFLASWIEKRFNWLDGAYKAL